MSGLPKLSLFVYFAYFVVVPCTANDQCLRTARELFSRMLGNQ